MKFITDKLRQHNSWVKQYRSLLVEIDERDDYNMTPCVFLLKSPFTLHPRQEAN